jgi:cytochrome c biogenesis protein CcmG, thiol:disulfide interchange protein DsbE
VALLAVAGIVAAELLSGSGGSAKAAPRLPRQTLVPPRVTIADLRGKPAAINFWASWCDPCRKEAPGLAALARSLRGRARLVGVDWGDSAGGARAFIRRYAWRFPNLRDANGTIGDAYGIRGLPTTFIVNPSGRIADVLRGPQTATDIRQALGSVG